MKIRKFGTETVYIIYDDDHCPWCEAAKQVIWEEDGGIIFFENEVNEVRRIDALRSEIGLIGILCTPSSISEAKRFISQLEEE